MFTLGPGTKDVRRIMSVRASVLTKTNTNNDAHECALEYQANAWDAGEDMPSADRLHQSPAQHTFHVREI